MTARRSEMNLSGHEKSNRDLRVISNANPVESGEKSSLEEAVDSLKAWIDFSEEAADLSRAAMILDARGHREMAEQLIRIARMPLPVRVFKSILPFRRLWSLQSLDFSRGSDAVRELG